MTVSLLHAYKNTEKHAHVHDSALVSSEYSSSPNGKKIQFSFGARLLRLHSAGGLPYDRYLPHAPPPDSRQVSLTVVWLALLDEAARLD